MAAHRGAVVLLCVHAGRIRGRVFRGKTDLSAHRCRRGALCGQLHAFPAGAVRFHPAFRPFFLWVRLRLRQLGDAVWALSGLIQKKLFHRKKQLRLPERAVLLGQKVKYLLLAWLVALYVTRQEKMLTGTSPWEVFSRLTALHLPPEGFGVGIGLLVLILLGMALHPGLQRLQAAVPGVPEAGGNQPAQRGMHRL